VACGWMVTNVTVSNTHDWYDLDDIAKAWCSARGPSVLARYKERFKTRLLQGPYGSAVWDALRDVGLKTESAHMKTWTISPNPLPARMASDGTVSVYLGQTSGGHVPSEAPAGSPCPVCPGLGVHGYPCPLRR